MRIKKQYQVIPTNAKLENGDSTSATNGYTAEYINDHSVVVSPTEPSGSARKKVWKQHENIFDNTSPQTFSNTTTLSSISSGIRATVTTSGLNTSSLACIDIGAISDFVGKKITVKFKNNSSTNKGRIYLGKSNVGQTNRQLIVDSGTIENGTHIIQTDTIANDTSYPRLFLAIYGNGSDISVNVNTYVDYTDFVVSTIEDKEYILNNNVYEEFDTNKGTILYNNSSGNNATITLNDNVTNYKYLEIYTGFGGANSRIVCQKIDLSISSVTNLFNITSSSSPAGEIYIRNRTVTISGNTISTLDSNRYSNVSISTSGTISNSNTNEIYIYKVIGYK